jgi:hypothetical protein
MKFEFSSRIFEKYSDIKFGENLTGGCQVVACVRTDGQIDMTKLVFLAIL